MRTSQEWANRNDFLVTMNRDQHRRGVPLQDHVRNPLPDDPDGGP